MTVLHKSRSSPLSLPLLYLLDLLLDLGTCSLNLVVLTDQAHPAGLKLLEFAAGHTLLVLALPVDLLDLLTQVLEHAGDKYLNPLFMVYNSITLCYTVMFHKFTGFKYCVLYALNTA